MEKAYFAASNSCDGFKNYYGECFARAERLFIIKGGPGTGKSTLMRRVAEVAEGRGYYTERYYCSSDHTSLDGVLFEGESGCVGIIDGTFPHPYVEKLPGLCEEIVNTGGFWDRKILKARGEEIRQLCAEKSRYYGAAYAYLRACGNLRAVCSSYELQGLDGEKMTGAVTRIAKRIPDGDGFLSTPALVNCIGMLGRAHLSSFEEQADRIYIISGGAAGGVLLSDILSVAKQKKLKVRVAYHPIYHRELEGVYFEASRLWFALEDALPSDTAQRHENKVTPINMKRFCADGDASSKREKKYCRRLSEACIDGALSQLARAGECHFGLEECYKSAMDFSALEEYSERLIKRIFE